MHRIETIMAAVGATVTGLATTAGRVYRGRATPLAHSPEVVQFPSHAQLPALLVNQGADEIASNDSGVRLICTLDVNIDVVVTNPDELALDSLLNQVRAEVTVALTSDAAQEADYQLGLPAIVHQIEELGAEEPLRDATGERPLATQRLLWRVTFDRSRIDPSN